MQIRLSTLLLLVTIIALAIGWWVDRHQYVERLNTLTVEAETRLIDAVAATKHSTTIRRAFYLDYLADFDLDRVPGSIRQELLLQIYRVWRHRDEIDEFGQPPYVKPGERKDSRQLACRALAIAGCDSWEVYAEKCLKYHDALDIGAKLFPAIRETDSPAHKSLSQFIKDSLKHSGGRYDNIETSAKPPATRILKF